MAMQPEIRYINAYVSGTAAPQPERRPQKHTSAQLPKVKKQLRYVIPVDLVAVGGILSAVVLVIMLTVGLVQMNQAQKEAELYQEYAMSLQEENEQLQDTYKSGYDLEEIRQIATAMGMVPMDQVPHLQIQVETPQEEPQPTPLESFWAFFLGMFA